MIAKVFSSLEQFLSIRIKNWRALYMSPTKVYSIISGIIIFFVVINANAFFFNGVNGYSHGNHTYVCSNDMWFIVWGYVTDVVLTLTPVESNLKPS